MDFYSDNSVWDVWVNGQPQGVRSNIIYTNPSDPAQNEYDRYNYQGFRAGTQASGELKASWHSGLNTIIVHIKSAPPSQGFLGQMKVTTLCPKVTIAKTLSGESGTLAGQAEPGEELRYQITLTNHGGSPVTDYALSDRYDANTEFVLADQGGADDGAQINWRALTIPAQVGGTAGTLVLNATLKVKDPLPAGTSQVANVAYRSDETPPDCSAAHPQCVTIPTAGAVTIAKTLSGESGTLAGQAEPGEELRYQITLTNHGGSPVTDYALSDRYDANTEFVLADQGGADDGAQINWSALTIPAQVGGTAGTLVLNATLKVKDPLPAGTSQVANVAYRSDETPPDCSAAHPQCVVTKVAEPSDIIITKQASLRQIRRGEKAPFTIKVMNKSNRLVSDLNVTDKIPAGFRYVEDSAEIDGVATVPVVNGLNIVFTNLSVAANSEIVLRLQMLALSSAASGRHSNHATVTDSSGNTLAPAATAEIEIMVEPVFECGEIIGKVFDDRNSNGYQDEGEPGLPAVRVATVNGLLITTDKFGRFHVACAALPDPRIGSNFIMKLDPRTLPTGYRLTTENPRVVRLTAGKMTKINFGAALGRLVRLSLKDDAFVASGLELKKQWNEGLDQLIAVLSRERSTLRITYQTKNQKLAGQRMKVVQKEISRRWKAGRSGYQLNIETRVEAGK
ncbi:DUF11 domain-containing protein [Pseudochrobactrum saccharolyticum]|nr:DUF11 domain-containing protein [Pseudochrobactrum saccharolyticum]